MRKPLAVLLCAVSLAAPLTGCAKGAEAPEKNTVFIGTIEEVSDNDLLVTATAGEACFARASVSFAPEMGEPDFTPLSGQTVLLTVLPEVTGGDPAGVSAVGMEFVSGPMDFKATVMRTGCFEDSEEWQFLTSHSENIGGEKSASFIMPLMFFSGREELTAFIQDGSAFYWMDIAQSGDESFAAAVEQYDETYFTENRLVVLYIWDTIIGNRYEVNSVSVAGNILSVGVDTILPPPDHTISPAEVGYFCFVEVAKSTTASCTDFKTYSIITQE